MISKTRSSLNNSVNYQEIISSCINLEKTSNEINNRRIVNMDLLITPEKLINQLSVTRSQCETIHQTRVEIENIIDRTDHRLVVGKPPLRHVQTCLPEHRRDPSGK